jgi:hypothetical protein
MPKRVRQNVDRTHKTSFSETRSPREVALRRRSPRRLFECPCDECQGYATDDPEPHLDDFGEPCPDDV